MELLKLILDMFTGIEGERLVFIRSNQLKLKAKIYVNFRDAIRDIQNQFVLSF